MMPGAGAIDVRSAYLRLLDGLLALYHGAGIKHAEKVSLLLRTTHLQLQMCRQRSLRHFGFRCPLALLPLLETLCIFLISLAAT